MVGGGGVELEIMETGYGNRWCGVKKWKLLLAIQKPKVERGRENILGSQLGKENSG